MLSAVQRHAYERVDIIAYSRKYCEADCKVLKAAYYKFKELIATVCTYDCEDDTGDALVAAGGANGQSAAGE